MTVPDTSRPGRLSARAPAAEPLVLARRRRPGYLGPVHITQLLLVELIVVAVLVGIGQGVVAVAGAVVAGAVVLVLTLARSGGRWWLERRVMIWSYTRRKRARPVGPASNDPRLEAMRKFAPGMTVENIPVADGAQVGVARDDTGWYAVAAFTPRSAARNDPVTLALGTMTAALAEADQPGAVLQVVTQSLPAPSLHTPPSSPAGNSYQQLMSRFGAVTLPADRSTWVTVRLDGRMLAEAVNGDPVELASAPAVVAALVRRIVKVQRRAGITLRLLDADGLLDALVRACDLDQTQPDAAVHEDWSAWRSPHLAHRSFWISSWPTPSGASPMLDRLSNAPSAMTTVAVTIAPGPGGLSAELRGIVRVAATASELSQVCRTLNRRAHDAHASLFPLDGEQGPAVYATAPTGGGAQ